MFTTKSIGITHPKSGVSIFNCRKYCKKYCKKYSIKYSEIKKLQPDKEKLQPSNQDKTAKLVKCKERLK